MARVSPVHLLIVAALAGSACGQEPAAPDNAAPDRAAPDRAAPPTSTEPQLSLPARFVTAEDLLAALETADKAIRSLSADVQYSKTFSDIEGGGDKQIWRGKLYFDVPEAAGPAVRTPNDKPDARRRFAVIFDTLIVDVLRKESKHLIFDGEWFVERNEMVKVFTKRRVVKPGEQIDPLKLGEGPFPLPIGQKKADILRRFKAELLSPGAGLENESQETRDRFADTVQLRLTPIAKTREARDFAEIRIWYRLSDLLPRLARTRTAEGSQTEVLLIRHQLNQPIERHVFSTDAPTEPGWNIDIRDDARIPVDGDEPAAPGTPEAKNP